MTIFSHFPCAEQQSEAQIRGGQGRRTQGLISPSARWHLKLDGRVELERLEGRVQALYSVRVTAGRGGGGRMLAMLVMFMHLFMSFLHFLPHLLVHHHSWCYHARSQGIHRRHARGRWWVWRRVGTWWLASWIPWLWQKMRRPNWGESWIPLGSSWGSGKGSSRKDRIDRWWMDKIDRWWMDRIGTSRVSNVWGIRIWPWLPWWKKQGTN